MCRGSKGLEGTLVVTSNTFPTSRSKPFFLANQHHKLERAGQDWRSRVWTNQDRQGALVAPTVDAASHIEARSPVLRG